MTDRFYVVFTIFTIDLRNYDKSKSVLLPPLFHPLLDLRVHPDLVRPRPQEALPGAFARGVDPHLAAEADLRAGVVEDVERPVGDHHVTLRVHMVHDLPRHLGIVMDVDVLVADDHEL